MVDDAPGENGLLHIVYLRDGKMLLTRKRYGGWRDIQDEYEGYATSLGPWPVEEVVEFLDADYPELRPAAIRVAAFLQGQVETAEL